MISFAGAIAAGNFEHLLGNRPIDDIQESRQKQPGHQGRDPPQGRPGTEVAPGAQADRQGGEDHENQQVGVVNGLSLEGPGWIRCNIPPVLG